MFHIKGFPLVYRGSVKNLRAKSRPTKTRMGVFLFEYTDDYSIFDYGKMPDGIPGKGAAMAMGSAVLFEKLESAAAWKKLARSDIWNKIRDKSVRDSLWASPTLKMLGKNGLRTHYRGIVDLRTGRTVRVAGLSAPSHVIEVDAARIIHPKPLQFGGQRIWNYNEMHTRAFNHLLPLECVFRFGVPGGSSLLERVRIPGYMEQLGLSGPPREKAWLPRPVVEYSSKLEPADRYMDYEMALNISGLDNSAFEMLWEQTLLTAVFLLDIFDRAAIKLWDGKFEYLVTRRGLMLGDAITPDELRLTYKGIQISKEPLRQYYRRYEKGFTAAMREARLRAKKVDKSLRSIVCDDLGSPPPPLHPDVLAAVSEMYKGLAEKVGGREFFGDVRPLSEVLRIFTKFKIN